MARAIDTSTFIEGGTMKHSFTQSETHINSLKELDELVSEGFFGENVSQLTLLEQQLSTSEYLYEILNDWSINDNQYKKMKLKNL